MQSCKIGFPDFESERLRVLMPIMRRESGFGILYELNITGPADCIK